MTDPFFPIDLTLTDRNLLGFNLEISVLSPLLYAGRFRLTDRPALDMFPAAYFLPDDSPAVVAKNGVAGPLLLFVEGTYYVRRKIIKSR